MKTKKGQNEQKSQNQINIMTLTTKPSHQYNLTLQSPVYHENPLQSSKNHPLSSHPYKTNANLLDSSIPLTQSKDFRLNESKSSFRKSTNRIFSAETPTEPKNFKKFSINFSRPQTSVLIKNEEFAVFEETSPNSIIHLSPNKKFVKKSRKEAPFEMISQYTKVQNEDFLQKMRVLSAISRKTDAKFMEDVNAAEKYEEIIHKEEEPKDVEQSGLLITQPFEDNDIYGKFLYLLI